MQNISIRVAVENRFLHVIAARNGEPISATDIARETASDIFLTSEITEKGDCIVLIVTNLCSSSSTRIDGHRAL